MIAVQGEATGGKLPGRSANTAILNESTPCTPPGRKSAPYPRFFSTSWVGNWMGEVQRPGSCTIEFQFQRARASLTFIAVHQRGGGKPFPALLACTCRTALAEYAGKIGQLNPVPQNMKKNDPSLPETLLLYPPDRGVRHCQAIYFNAENGAWARPAIRCCFLYPLVAEDTTKTMPFFKDMDSTMKLVYPKKLMKVNARVGYAATSP